MEARFEAKLKDLGISSLYYLTDMKNVSSILAWGIFSHNLVQDVTHSDISWSTVQDHRKREFVETSLILHDYVPLFFALHTPMQFVVTHVTGGLSPSLTQEQLVILQLDAQTVFRYPGVMFTSGNAASYCTKFMTEPDELDELNWSVIKYMDRCCSRFLKHAKSAEVLAPRHIPTDAISHVLVYNDSAQAAFEREIVSFFEGAHRLLREDWHLYWTQRCRVDQRCFF